MDRLTLSRAGKYGSSATQSYQRRFRGTYHRWVSRTSFQRGLATKMGSVGRTLACSVRFQAEQQRVQVLRVLFFDRKDIAHHAVRRRVLAVQIRDDLAVAFDRNALGDQVLADHVDQRRPSTYSECARAARFAGFKSGSPPSCTIRSAMRSA